MKLEIEVNNKIVALDWQQNDNQLTATIDGISYQAELLCNIPNVYTLLLNNRVYEFSLENNSNNNSHITILGRSFTTKVVDRRQSHSKAQHNVSGKQPIIAPMPGRVVQILKNVGDEVNLEEGVIIVEAMKMQNELGSPKKGKVIAIKVQSGQTVAANEVLAIIE
jgi:biotin carboxyl carrier protein